MNAAVESKLLIAARVLVVILPLCLIGGRVAVDAALSLTAILFLVYSFRTRDWQWTRRTWFRIATLLWLWMLLISPFAYEPRLSFSQAGPWIRFVIFTAALEHWVLDEVWMRRLLWTTTAAVAFVAGDTWLQYLTGTDLFGHPRPEPERLSGPFDGLRPGSYITRMMFPALLGIFVWRAWPRPWVKGALLVLLLLTVGAVFVSGERMALLLALGGLALAAVLQKGALRRLLLGSLVLAAVAVAALALVDTRMLGRHVDETVATAEHFADSPYGQIWRSALHLAAERPLQGVGMKNFRVACADPVLGLPAEVKVRCATHTHNTYLEFLTESGMPGLLLFVALVAAWAIELWRAWRIKPHDPWLLGPLVAAAVLLWPFGPTASFFSNWFGAMVWLFMGWALAAVRLRRMR
jgi:hypothetical protein